MARQLHCTQGISQIIFMDWMDHSRDQMMQSCKDFQGRSTLICVRNVYDKDLRFINDTLYRCDYFCISSPQDKYNKLYYIITWPYLLNIDADHDFTQFPIEENCAVIGDFKINLPCVIMVNLHDLYSAQAIAEQALSAQKPVIIAAKITSDDEIEINGLLAKKLFDITPAAEELFSFYDKSPLYHSIYATCDGATCNVKHFNQNSVFCVQI
jgi:hypothetical protein